MLPQAGLEKILRNHLEAMGVQIERGIELIGVRAVTALGEEIHAAHRSLHEEMGNFLDEFLVRYTPDDLEVLSRILDDLMRMPRDGVRFRPDLLD